MGARGNERENIFGMMPPQRPEDLADRRRDRSRHQSPALAALPDLGCIPIDVLPAQQALIEPQSGGLHQAKDRKVIVAGGFMRSASSPTSSRTRSSGSLSQWSRHFGSWSKRTPQVFARVNSFFNCSVVSLTVNGEIRTPSCAR